MAILNQCRAGRLLVGRRGLVARGWFGERAAGNASYGLPWRCVDLSALLAGDRGRRSGLIFAGAV